MIQTKYLKVSFSHLYSWCFPLGKVKAAKYKKYKNIRSELKSVKALIAIMKRDRYILNEISLKYMEYP